MQDPVDKYGSAVGDRVGAARCAALASPPLLQKSCNNNRVSRTRARFGVTVPHTGPPVDAADLDAALAALRQRGTRVSASRRLVLEALFVAGGPVTAESIARGLEGHVTPTDLASVYRNLETLEQVGLVRTCT